MEIPGDLRYTKSHEWARRESGDIVVGITAHAQQELKDVVFVELPAVGREVKQGEPVAVVESVKAAFDIYAPLSGTVSRINDALVRTPQLINDNCYEAGWMFAITPSVAEEEGSLLNAEAYSEQLKSAA